MGLAVPVSIRSHSSPAPLSQQPQGKLLFLCLSLPLAPFLWDMLSAGSSSLALLVRRPFLSQPALWFSEEGDGLTYRRGQGISTGGQCYSSPFPLRPPFAVVPPHSVTCAFESVADL